MPIGPYLKYLRTVKEPSWTLQKVSDMSGISVGHLSDIERGEAEPSLKAIIALAEVYGMGAGDLLVAAGYTINPALPWQCDANFRIICRNGDWEIVRLSNGSSEAT